MPEMPTTPSITRSVVAGTLCTTRPPAVRNAASAFWWVRSGLSRTAAAAAPRRRRNVAAHSASPPLSPEPTTAQTDRPATPPVRAHELAGDRGGQRRRPPAASAHRRAATPAAVLRLRGSRRRSSSTASAVEALRCGRRSYSLGLQVDGYSLPHAESESARTRPPTPLVSRSREASVPPLSRWIVPITPPRLRIDAGHCP